MHTPPPYLSTGAGLWQTWTLMRILAVSDVWIDATRGGYLGLGPPLHETPHADTLVQQAADARATFL